jgi:serine/threonine-protein kinase
MPSISPGAVVGGRYRVEHSIGTGGMGSVVAARDLHTDTPVAIKHLLAVHDGNREVHTRFEREARVAGWIKSEHVAKILDTGEHVVAGGRRSQRYLVMELLEGRDLRSLVRDAGPLHVEDAVDYVRQACEGLAEAHAVGIVHRDLKPANLFCARGPGGAAIIKVLDFGIAKFQSPNVAGDELEMTGPATMLGSRPFMSPEQMLDAKEVDARADVWALGTILFYLLTGQSPFEGEHTSDLMLNILQGEPRALSSLRPDAPPGLDAVVGRCVEKLRDRRYANVVELWRALAPFGRREAAPSPPKLGTETLELPKVAIWPPPPSPSDETLTVVRSPRDSQPASKPQRRAWIVAAAITVAAIAAVAVAVTGSTALVARRAPPAAHTSR